MSANVTNGVSPSASRMIHLSLVLISVRNAHQSSTNITGVSYGVGGVVSRVGVYR